MISKNHILNMQNGKLLLTTEDVNSILMRSEDGRKSYIKRAVKEGSLIRIKPGLYLLSDNHRPYNVSPYYIAQAIHSRSYISMESALSYHGWIPEAVYSTVSIKNGRKTKELHHATLGHYAFYTIAINRLHFLQGVCRVKQNKQVFLMATPLRSLMDLVAYKKIEWQGLEWLENGMRIEPDHYMAIKKREFHALRYVYKHKRAKEFLAEFENSIYRRKR